MTTPLIHFTHDNTGPITPFDAYSHTFTVTYPPAGGAVTSSIWNYNFLDGNKHNFKVTVTATAAAYAGTACSFYWNEGAKNPSTGHYDSPQANGYKALTGGESHTWQAVLSTDSPLPFWGFSSEYWETDISILSIHSNITVSITIDALPDDTSINKVLMIIEQN